LYALMTSEKACFKPNNYGPRIWLLRASSSLTHELRSSQRKLLDIKDPWRS